MANFPIMGVGAGFLSQGESPSKFDHEPEVNVSAADTEGGYEFRRERTTRRPRETLKTGFISIPHTDKQILEAFWAAHRTTVAFTYFDYINSIYRTVRFSKAPKWNYDGIGRNRMWSPDFEMKEI